MAQAPNQPALLQLADKIAIAEVINTYADCVDRRDFDGVYQCFHPEATYQYQEDGVPLPFREFFESMADVGAGLRETMHYMTNFLIKVEGDSAQAQSYILAHHWLPEDCPPNPPLFPQTGREYGLFIGARYHDRFERRDDDWRILQRKLCYEWDAPIPAPAVSGPLGNIKGTVAGIF